jgi:hypothetical protein
VLKCFRKGFVAGFCERGNGLSAYSGAGNLLIKQLRNFK